MTAIVPGELVETPLFEGGCAEIEGFSIRSLRLLNLNRRTGAIQLEGLVRGLSRERLDPSAEIRKLETPSSPWPLLG